MRRLDLDFIEQPSLSRRLGIGVLIVALGAAAYAGKIYVDRKAELERLEAQLNSLNNRQPNKAVSNTETTNAADQERLQVELATANRVIARLSMPWDALFREIEASVTGDVTLLSVEPDPEKREVRITAESKNLGTMLEYEQRLQSIALFKNAHIINHQVQSQDAQKPVRFTVTAQWLQMESSVGNQPAALPSVVPEKKTD